MDKSVELEVLIGLSTVGIEEVKKNLDTEIKAWNSFSGIRNQTNKKWGLLN